MAWSRTPGFAPIPAVRGPLIEPRESTLRGHSMTSSARERIDGRQSIGRHECGHRPADAGDIEGWDGYHQDAVGMGFAHCIEAACEIIRRIDFHPFEL